MIALVVVLVAVGLTFPSKRNNPTPQVIMPTVTTAPTGTPRPTVTPTNIIAINPRLVTLSSVALYEDYDEPAKIGNAPENLECFLTGQSPEVRLAFAAKTCMRLRSHHCVIHNCYFSGILLNYRRNRWHG